MLRSAKNESSRKDVKDEMQCVSWSGVGTGGACAEPLGHKRERW